MLNHVHLSDSNRLAPGWRHLDFEEILRTLQNFGHRGYLAFELIVPPGSPSGGPGREKALDDTTQLAIQHTTRIESRLERGLAITLSSDGTVVPRSPGTGDQLPRATDTRPNPATGYSNSLARLSSYSKQANFKHRLLEYR